MLLLLLVAVAVVAEDSVAAGEEAAGSRVDVEDCATLVGEAEQGTSCSRLRHLKHNSCSSRRADDNNTAVQVKVKRVNTLLKAVSDNNFVCLDWFTFLVSAHPGSPGKRAVKRMCVCV